ncbi:MAG TPA: ribosome maturation factor RimM [Actinomycetota bacterium]|nr:ribosome maturation factor RimM [Actinomycetota bacterium]
MDEPTVAIGRISRAHGVRGELSIVVLSEVPERFKPGATVRLEDGRALTIDAARPHRDRLLVRFREVADRTAAEALQGSLLVVSRSSSPPLPEGSWWDHDVEGCAVTTDTGWALGTVNEVIHTRANDIWSVVDTSGSETLIPVLKDVIVTVDTRGGSIVVREIPGLTIPEEGKGTDSGGEV